MVKTRLCLAVCVGLTSAAAAFAQSSYIFQLQGLTGLQSQIVGLGDNNFSRQAGPSLAPVNATRVVATPNGSKFYILASGGVFSANSTLSSITPVSAISGTATAAEVTPDGKYLLVVTDHFYIVKTTDDSLAAVADTGVPVGSTPVAVAASHDGKSAWILSNTTTGSAVTAVNLTSLEISGGALNLPSSASSMTLSSRNLLYVNSNADRIYEIDPISLSVTPNGQMQVASGIPGPLQFTPDGNSAYFLNRTSNCSICPPFLKLNAQTHTIAGWLPTNGTTPPAIDQILVAGNSRIFAYSSSSTQLWDIAPSPLALTPSSFNLLPTSSVMAAAVSDERPSSRFLYLLAIDQTFYRVNLATNGIDQQSSLDPVNGIVLSFVPIPATSGEASLFQINPVQNVAPGGTTALIGQFLDSAGRPVTNVQATFSSDPAVTLATPSVVTNAGGWAQTTLTAPAVAGTYNVVLASGNLSANFQLVVGGGTGPTGSPLISIYAGDGQLLKQNQTTLDTLQPLTVRVTDSEGNPLENIAVSFSVTEGLGSIFGNPQPTTGANGLASANFQAGVLFSNTPYLLAKVTATSAVGSVEFYEVVREVLNNDVAPPNSLITAPSNQKLTIPQGGLILGGITASTLSGTTGKPIPNVGIRITDPVDETKPSTVVSCKGLTRGDNNGISRCDVQAFCQPTIALPHVFVAHIRVGEYKSYGLEVTVTDGTASVLSIIGGNNQTGRPSDSFTLFARVTDGCSKPTSVNGLVWSIIQGSASFSQAQDFSDTSGNVSARVTLGQAAGPVRIQLTGPNLSPITFNLTTQIAASSISLVSGGGQSVVVGNPFPNPVVFIVRDPSNTPVPNVLVNFSLSGSSATLTPGSATTNALGQVQTNVTAGGSAGNIVVTATSGSFIATATLSSTLPAPVITGNNFRNAASGTVGMTPCGLVTVTGAGIAPSVQGAVNAINFFGPLPNTLAGVSISVQQNTNSVQVPILKVINDQAGQSATFQAPCDLIPGTAIVVITVNGGSTTVQGVPVATVQPGIFTNPNSNGKQYATVIRAVDGTYVTPSNPARRGERLYIVLTGLGQVTPAAITNSVGAGSQNANLPILVVLGDRFLGTLSARYMFGSVGSYLVEFQLPADAALGPDQNLLVIATSLSGTEFLGVGNTVLLPAVIAAQ